MYNNNPVNYEYNVKLFSKRNKTVSLRGRHASIITTLKQVHAFQVQLLS